MWPEDTSQKEKIFSLLVKLIFLLQWPILFLWIMLEKQAMSLLQPHNGKSNENIFWHIQSYILILFINNLLKIYFWALQLKYLKNPWTSFLPEKSLSFYFGFQHKRRKILNSCSKDRNFFFRSTHSVWVTPCLQRRFLSKQGQFFICKPEVSPARQF